LDKALSNVQDLTSIVKGVANALNDPWSLMVSNVDIGFPAEVAMGGAKFTLNADKWPSAKEIAEKLASLHRARHQATSLWMSLSETDRKNLAPPQPM